MDLPANVLIHNQLLGIKGGKGTLVAVNPHGYFEARCGFGGKTHRVLFPIQGTVIIFSEPEPEPELEPGIEIER